MCTHTHICVDTPNTKSNRSVNRCFSNWHQHIGQQSHVSSTCYFFVCKFNHLWHSACSPHPIGSWTCQSNFSSFLVCHATDFLMLLLHSLNLPTHSNTFHNLLGFLSLYHLAHPYTNWSPHLRIYIFSIRQRIEESIPLVPLVDFSSPVLHFHPQMKKPMTGNISYLFDFDTILTPSKSTIFWWMCLILATPKITPEKDTHFPTKWPFFSRFAPPPAGSHLLLTI